MSVMPFLEMLKIPACVLRIVTDPLYIPTLLIWLGFIVLDVIILEVNLV